MQTKDTKANYYALFLSIVCKISSSSSLQKMGLSTKEGRKLLVTEQAIAKNNTAEVLTREPYNARAKFKKFKFTRMVVLL